MLNEKIMSELPRNRCSTKDEWRNIVDHACAIILVIIKNIPNKKRISCIASKNVFYISHRRRNDDQQHIMDQWDVQTHSNANCQYWKVWPESGVFIAHTVIHSQTSSVRRARMTVSSSLLISNIYMKILNKTEVANTVVSKKLLLCKQWLPLLRVVHLQPGPSLRYWHTL